MSKSMQIKIFGKAGCQKCKVLTSRLDALLEKPEWQEFEKVYCDVETEDGIVDFSQMECINPQRIPAFIILRKDETGRAKPLANPAPGAADKVCGSSRLYQYVGLQTDYSDQGKGLITPKMIQSVLYQAKELQN